MIRFIHTADWHLGRILDQKSLIEDQRWVLEHRFLPLLDQSKPDLLIIAGDVYDRQVPSQEAVDLLDAVLSEIILSRRIPVMMIAGNHDSGSRLAFGSELLRVGGLYVAGRISGEPLVMSFPDKGMSVVGLPYFDPPEMRALLQDPSLDSHNAAVRAWLERQRNVNRGPGGRILAGHLFTQNGRISESERLLAPGRVEECGGAGQIDPSLFEGWDFVALGHLHSPQQPAERVSYSGSLLQYAFSETFDKSVTLVELEPATVPRLTRHTLEPLRRLRTVRGSYDEILAGAAQDAARDDYIRAEYQAEHPIPFVMERLRERYPNVLEVIRVVPEAVVGGASSLGIGHVREFSLEQLLETFCRTVSGGDVPAGQMELLAELAAASEAGREGGDE